MKVVVNRCWGGFSVSREALEWLRARGVVEALGETSCGEQYRDEKGNGIGRVRGDYTHVGGKGPWREDNSYFLHEMSRAQKDLVECVETLGDRANGSCARLQVVEVPDDVEWEISDYDGQEHVAEVHRTW